jgi:transglutaminase-like putative cysteine protease
VVTGKPTPYGQYNKANGVILSIQEQRANKKTTIKVPFTNGKIHYEYPLSYSVGDVILNLDEFYNGKEDDPDKVLGFAQYHLTDGDPYLLPSYMVQSNDPTLSALAQNIINGKSTETEKSRAIFEWVTKNIAYNAPLINSTNPPLYSATETYQSQVVLCSGYADLSAALHRAAGIEAKVVYGENHAWNEIMLNGVWQSEDPTYGAGFINANTNKFVRSYHPAYFLKTDKHKEGEYPW